MVLAARVMSRVKTWPCPINMAPMHPHKHTLAWGIEVGVDIAMTLSTSYVRAVVIKWPGPRCKQNSAKQRMCRACRDAGMQPPKLLSEMSSATTLLRLPNPAGTEPCPQQSLCASH